MVITVTGCLCKRKVESSSSAPNSLLCKENCYKQKLLICVNKTQYGEG